MTLYFPWAALFGNWILAETVNERRQAGGKGAWEGSTRPDKFLLMQREGALKLPLTCACSHLPQQLSPPGTHRLTWVHLPACFLIPPVLWSCLTAFCAVSTVLTQLSELTSSTPRNPSSPEQAMAFLCVTPKWQEELLFVGWDTQLKGESAYIAGWISKQGTL